MHSLTTPEAVELVQPECPSPVKLSAGQYSFSPCLMELQPLCGELLAECEMPEACQQQQRHKRRKVMPQQYLENTPPENEYEKQRQERIQRNRQIMAELGVQQAAAEIKQAMQKPKKQKTAVQPKASTWHAYQLTSSTSTLDLHCISKRSQDLLRSCRWCQSSPPPIATCSIPPVTICQHVCGGQQQTLRSV